MNRDVMLLLISTMFYGQAISAATGPLISLTDGCLAGIEPQNIELCKATFPALREGITAAVSAWRVRNAALLAQFRSACEQRLAAEFKGKEEARTARAKELNSWLTETWLNQLKTDPNQFLRSCKAISTEQFAPNGPMELKPEYIEQINDLSRK